MRNTNSFRLWRVEWCHSHGYQAPAQVVEAESYKQAHRQVIAGDHRLRDFPKVWRFRLTELPYVWNGTRWS